MPSTFASAAAGNSADSSSRRGIGRSESGTFGEWGRRPNGATQTFRRPSLATNNSTSHATANQRDSAQAVTSPTAGTGAYVPPHLTASRNGAANAEARYSKDQLLQLFRTQRRNGELEYDISDLFVGDWDRLNRHDDSSDVPVGPEVCLDHNPSSEPLGLYDLSHDEREIFTSSVNSQMKAPNQGGQREGPHRDISGARKMSFSQGHGTVSASSPFSARPLGRRRDTNESFPFPKDSVSSPSTSKFGREDPPPNSANPLRRRGTDLKDPPFDRTNEEMSAENEDEGSGAPFGLPRRISTGPLSAGLTGPQSPWSAGGLGSLGAVGSSGAMQKRPGGPNRSESRFKNLMSRDSTERIKGLGRLNENEFKQQRAADRIATAGSDGQQRSYAVGSAALGGANDNHVLESLGGLKSATGQPHALSAQTSGHFSMDPNLSSFQDHRASLAHQSQEQGEEPSSPTFTNPYQSPEHHLANLHDYDPDDNDMNNLHLPGLGGLRNDQGLGGFSSGQSLNTSTAFDGNILDRTHAPISATTRGLSGLGGLNTLSNTSSGGPWPTALGSATSGREYVFPGFGDVHAQSENAQQQAFPGLAGLGSPGIEGLNEGMKGLASSRLSSLFPSSMQEQMSSHEGSSLQDRPRGGYDPFSARSHDPKGFSAGSTRRDQDNPFSPAEARSNELFRREDRFSDPMGDGHISLQSQYSPPGVNSESVQDHLQRRTSSDEEPLANQPPAAQQKTMVMPDRIRWIYRDPQGNTQGPWSGLEMHDWYRAGFFSPELLVKKVEDPDYEPLAQLIRRIGNSREPFLVPQIGIPGPPSASGSWPAQPPAAAAPAPATSSAAPTTQPPFASSFPSFGTTLTAEQQNALERRKQEEQYLMARQKEHLAQQQILSKQRPVPGSAGLSGMQQSQSLQRHASAQSLSSQPSFGSMAAQGGGFAGGASANAQGMTNAFDSGSRVGQGAGAIGSGLETRVLGKSEDPDQAIGRSELGHGFDRQRYVQEHDTFNEEDEDEERIASMLRDRARLQQEQADAIDQSDDFGFGANRLQQFEKLQHEQQRTDEDYEVPDDIHYSYHHQESSDRARIQDHKLTLTEQVQKAASAKQSPSSAAQSSWANRIDKPMAESPPTSGTSSPLPAPAARRNGRQSVADALAAESSKPSSPAVDTPSASIAPWAREISESSQKQPSLKEIQEAEARRAAKRDEEQTALRRAAFERELASQAPPPAPGLPSSSNWASSESVTSPSGPGPSAWTKPHAKPVTTPGGSKKTLQQIQKEEEALAKRQKSAAAATAAVHGNAATALPSATQAVSAGKRYADLASRVAAQAPNASSAWTTVGVGGKVKTPVTPNPPALQRAATGSLINNVATPAGVKKPVSGPLRANSSGTTLTAYDEFKKWAIGELRTDVSKGVDPQDLVNTLLDFPPDKDLITETVHSASNTIDSRHFAEEFVKRRALAEKGKAQPPSNLGGPALSSQSSNSAKGGGGGWSEVARKGPAPAPKEDPSFRIVPNKKKGTKR